MSFLVPVLQDILIGSSRKIGPIAVTVVVNESTNDTLTITKQPVQQGATITDHAYKEPTTFSTMIYQQETFFSGLDVLYQDLLDLQISRVPFDIVTPKRIYRNMLLAVLGVTTDKTTENCLAINATFQEVIIVKLSIVQIPRIAQKFPAVTGATEKAGRKNSAPLDIVQGVNSRITGFHQ